MKEKEKETMCWESRHSSVTRCRWDLAPVANNQCAAGGQKGILPLDWAVMKTTFVRGVEVWQDVGLGWWPPQSGFGENNRS